jgi:hypothetical protein
MAITRSQKCEHENIGEANVCPDCGVRHKRSPLVRFTFFYFVGGIIFVLLYGIFVDRDVAIFVVVNWLALGIAVALIAYGLPRKDSDDVAGLIYIIGIAWLVLLLAAGIVLIWNDGIGVQELQWLLD